MPRDTIAAAIAEQIFLDYHEGGRAVAQQTMRRFAKVYGEKTVMAACSLLYQERQKEDREAERASVAKLNAHHRARLNK
jgi:hypothetical protein